MLFPSQTGEHSWLIFCREISRGFFLPVYEPLPGLSKSFEMMLAAGKCLLNNEAECFSLCIFTFIILLFMFSFHSENCAFCAALIIFIFSFFQTLSEIAILTQCFKLSKAVGYYHLQLLKFKGIFIYKYLPK